jgi:hypothetical protein
MPIAMSAVAVVGVLCLLDLLLTFGVIRRLREQANLISGIGRSGPGVIDLLPGQFPGSFSAITATGESVNNATGLRVVAFVSASCSACPERVPAFAEYLVGNRIEPATVLVVVRDADGTLPAYLDLVAGLARVYLEPADGEVGQAFKVTGFPAFCLLDADGAVVASGYDPSALPTPVAA